MVFQKGILDQFTPVHAAADVPASIDESGTGLESMFDSEHAGTCAAGSQTKAAYQAQISD